MYNGSDGMCYIHGLKGVRMTIQANVADMSLMSFKAVQTFISNVNLDGSTVLRAVKDPAVIPVDEATYAKLQDYDFSDGVIEVSVHSRLLPDAPAFARGFIGVAFRINEDDTAFECMYIRPTNGRSEDQLRRNRSTQYFSFPDYKFDRFREENPGVYESYADIGLDEWIDIRIVVEGSRARMFLNGGSQPVLIVNDLKHGSDGSGSVGLWVEVGTEGFFKDLRITPVRNA
jgi:hypothetical protein